MTALPFSLTPREAQIIALVAEGLDNAEIGKRLYLSPHMVKHHIRRAGLRMGVTDRGGMVGLAYRTGVLSLPKKPGRLKPQPVVLDAVVDELLAIRAATTAALRAAGAVMPRMGAAGDGEAA